MEILERKMGGEDRVRENTEDEKEMGDRTRGERMKERRWRMGKDEGQEKKDQGEEMEDEKQGGKNKGEKMRMRERR